MELTFFCEYCENEIEQNKAWLIIGMINTYYFCDAGCMEEWELYQFQLNSYGIVNPPEDE